MVSVSMGRAGQSHTENHELVVIVKASVKWYAERNTLGTDEIIVGLRNGVSGNILNYCESVPLTTVKRKKSSKKFGSLAGASARDSHFALIKV